jgi:hypothetical protein
MRILGFKVEIWCIQYLVHRLIIQTYDKLMALDLRQLGPTRDRYLHWLRSWSRFQCPKVALAFVGGFQAGTTGEAEQESRREGSTIPH